MSEEQIRDICKRYGNLFAEVDACEDILDAFMLEKPLSSVEIHDAPPDDVEKLEEELSKFFFVRKTFRPTEELRRKKEFSGEIFVSRFKNLPDIAVEYGGLTDKYADLAGILYSYGAKKTAEYLKKWGWTRKLFK